MVDRDTALAAELMAAFAERTGLTSKQRPQRYLWTDAFAVCNDLGLHAATGDPAHLERALRLVDRVHHVLGRHREDDPRTGWISGLDDAEGEERPTAGGLRIGKPEPERPAGEPYDPRREWDRDGQYFHYLTKWMHALDQLARRIEQGDHDRWARELAVVAQRAFTLGSPGRRRMVWKLSIDLTRTLVPSMGQHDPLDGYVTCAQLEATASARGRKTDPALAHATAELAAMVDRDGLGTADPLGLGGILTDACRLTQLDRDPALVTSLLLAAADGVAAFREEREIGRPPHHRLAFRELGLAIGIAAVELLATAPLQGRLDDRGREALADLLRHQPLRAELTAFWSRDFHRGSATWLAHGDINDVMLATALRPAGFLDLGTGARAPRSRRDASPSGPRSSV